MKSRPAINHMKTWPRGMVGFRCINIRVSAAVAVWISDISKGRTLGLTLLVPGFHSGTRTADALVVIAQGRGFFKVCGVDAPFMDAGMINFVGRRKRAAIKQSPENMVRMYLCGMFIIKRHPYRYGPVIGVLFLSSGVLDAPVGVEYEVLLQRSGQLWALAAADQPIKDSLSAVRRSRTQACFPRHQTPQNDVL